MRINVKRVSAIACALVVTLATAAPIGHVGLEKTASTTASTSFGK